MGCDQNNGECCKNEKSLDYLVCTCLGVMHSEIVQAIEQGACSFEKLSELLGVGTGCSSCVQEVKELLKQYEQGSCGKRR